MKNPSKKLAVAAGVIAVVGFGGAAMSSAAAGASNGIVADVPGDDWSTMIDPPRRLDRVR